MAFRQACPLHYGAWRLFDLHRNAIFGKQIAILCDPNWSIERTGKDHKPDGRHFGPATFSVVLLKKVMNSASICQSLDAIPPTVAMPIATLQNARLSQIRPARIAFSPDCPRLQNERAIFLSFAQKLVLTLSRKWISVI
jgi:hypothetical protein